MTILNPKSLAVGAKAAMALAAKVGKVAVPVGLSLMGSSDDEKGKNDDGTAKKPKVKIGMFNFGRGDEIHRSSCIMGLSGDQQKSIFSFLDWYEENDKLAFECFCGHFAKENEKDPDGALKKMTNVVEVVMSHGNERAARHCSLAGFSTNSSTEFLKAIVDVKRMTVETAERADRAEAKVEKLKQKKKDTNFVKRLLWM